MNPKKKEHILNNVSSGKGVIPYEIITNMESFFLRPEKEFWEKAEFYNKLKQKAVDDEEYENAKYLYLTLKMRHLGDLNDLYNAQDVILRIEMVENRFQAMQDTYGFNPRKCNSASSMSGYIEREMSKIIIALPTKVEHVEFFEKTVTGGFSAVNTRLPFDTQILLPNDLTNNNKKKLNYKLVYIIKNDNGIMEQKRVITKILKLDENNQYGNGMTKPLPTGCIEDDSDISWETFHILLENISFEDEIGHMYVADIKLDVKNATERQLVYNEIYPPIIEKQKIIDPCERPTFQLLDNFSQGENGASAFDQLQKLTKQC